MCACVRACVRACVCVCVCVCACVRACVYPAYTELLMSLDLQCKFGYRPYLCHVFYQVLYVFYTLLTFHISTF